MAGRPNAAESEPLTPPAAEKAARSALACALLVGAYAAAIYLPFLGGDSRILTSHEVMVTQPALRLLADGEWIVPHYASGRWLDKPPLAPWITAASFAALGGFSEFAARLPAALSAVALCVLVFVLADRLYSRRAAVFAGLMQATCVCMYMQGRLGETDIVFTLLVVAAHAVLVRHWARGRIDLPLGTATLMYALAGLAMLAKGVVAVVFVGGAVLAFCALRRTWRPLRAALFSPGIVAFLAIVVPWHVAAYQIAGAEALNEWRYNSLLRFLGLHHLGGEWPIFYFYTILWLMLPWSIVLLVGATRLWRDARREDAWTEHALWAWFLGGLVFLTICIFKHQHYAMPILPPLTILAAHLLDLHYGQIGAHRRRALLGLFIALPLVYGAVSGIVMPLREHRRVTADFVRAETARVPADEPLYVIGLGQSMAYPYVQHADCVYLDTAEGVLAALDARGGKPLWVIAPREHLALVDKYQLDFAEVAGEPVRKKHPWDKTLVIGRLSR